MSTLIAALDVPGARLHYEVRGTGPALLMMPGANGDAGPFKPMAEALADRYTVVTYDRRGFSRSRVDGPVVDAERMASDVDDAHRLLSLLGDAPAYVLGSCSGAIVALELLARHPAQVRAMVSHEPPLASVLPDADRWYAFYDELYDMYRTVGTKAARKEFTSRLGLGELPRPPEGTELPVEFTEMVARIRVNQYFWWEHEVRSYPAFALDLPALKAVSDRLVMAGGSTSSDLHPYQCALAVANLTGTGMVDFPGGHVGYMEFPEDFAEALDKQLSGW